MHREKYYKVYILYRPEKAKEYVANETLLPVLYMKSPPKQRHPVIKHFQYITKIPFTFTALCRK